VIIARSWHGQVPSRHASRFAEHLHATAIAEAAAVPGSGFAVMPKSACQRRPIDGGCGENA
jgi:hypothetical protein